MATSTNRIRDTFGRPPPSMAANATTTCESWASSGQRRRRTSKLMLCLVALAAAASKRHCCDALRVSRTTQRHVTTGALGSGTSRRISSYAPGTSPTTTSVFSAILRRSYAATGVPGSRRKASGVILSSVVEDTRAASTTASGTSPSRPVELKHMDFSSSSNHEDLRHPPVILLHGLLGSKRNFASLGGSLSRQLQNKRRVMAVDLRNHGENHHDWRDDMRYDAMALDVLDLLDRHGIADAVLVGHSMGGKVAQALALLHPERVSGLVVLDIAPVRYDEECGSWLAVKQIIDALCTLELEPGKAKKDVDADLRRAGVEDPALRAFVMTNLGGSSSQLKWKINLDAIAEELDVIAGFDVPLGSRPKYEGDTFFIHGGASRFIRHAHMQTIADYFPNHMLTTVRGAGHWVHAE